MSTGTRYAPRTRQAGSRTLPLSLMLLVIAGLLTLPASVAIWQERTLMNEEGFVSLGNEVLGKEAVQVHLASELAAGVEVLPNSAPGLNQLLGGTGLGGLLDSIGRTTTINPTADGSLAQSLAQQLIAALPNTPGAERALGLLRSQLVAAMRSDALQTEGDSIVLDLTEALPDLVPDRALAIGSLLPSEVARLEVAEKSDLSRLFQIGRIFDGRAIAFGLLPLAALVAGFFLASNWPRYVTQAGVVLMVSAVLWIVLALVVVKPIMVNKASGDQARDALSALHDVLAASFLRQELMLVALGAVLLVIGLVWSRTAARTV